MTLRRGFTLIEVMIALVISSVVVLLAYATLRAGVDTQERVSDVRDASERAMTLRAMLGDAMRHAITGDDRDARGMFMETDASGRAVQLGFVSRGITPPYGGAAAWRVALYSDTAGVSFSAAPLDAAQTPLRLHTRLVRSFAVRFLARDDAEWRTDWNDPTRLPAAIEVRLLDRAGMDALAPVVARTSPVSGT
jgi:prepilin-type N-terminal cleavage/methylation domain-containing protein